eukprot:scaffold20339_cov128-Cylindrotheca_fusiformis.AAC.16
MNDDQSRFTLVSSDNSNPTRDSTDYASTMGRTQNRETFQPPELLKREEANILKAKYLVALIILLAVSAVGTCTYLLVEDQERTNFENQFAGYSSEILTVSQQKASQFFSALDAFSVSISSQAIAENELRNTSWPFYVVPNWSIKAQRLAELTGVSHPEVVLITIVKPDERDRFNEFAALAIPKWYQESVEHEKTEMTAIEFWQKTIPYIYFADPENNFQPTPMLGNNESRPLFLKYPLGLSQSSPIMGTMYDAATAQASAALVDVSKAIRKPTIGFTVLYSENGVETPGSQIVQPIYDTADTEAEDRKMVAFAGIRLHWLDYFKNVLHDGEFGIIVVLKSDCPNLCAGASASSVVSYRIDGQNADYLGDSDMHDPKYNSMEITDVLVDLGIDESDVPGGHCIPTLTLHVYPSEDLEKSFHTSKATTSTLVMVFIFIFPTLVFLLYDYFVRRRQSIVMDRIMRQDKIVANVFPTAFRDRLYQSQEKQKKGAKNLESGDFNDNLDDLDFAEDSRISGSAPLADFFPSVSVVFADIAGFTAWSSAREPQQVFVLLETIYCAFDKIAYHHNVFKVETVGDCYVAAVGLPEPVDKHAVIACKFAHDCLKKMKEVTLKLEVSLGPDTGDLDLRIGVNSGQVTAGVLRGERSRFQLFGDTMNTAARMEQSGEQNRIQLSQATADMLTEAGHAHWIMPRGNKIYVKGKGEIQTYWLRKSKTRKLKGSDGSNAMTPVVESVETGEESDSLEDIGLGLDVDTNQGATKIERLVEWNVEILASLLQQIIASRGGVVKEIGTLSRAERSIGSGGTVLDEFTPIIPLKRFEADELRARRSTSSIDIGDEAKSQLRKYLSQIAGMYRDNPFHNFQHASHVTASVKKLLT